MRLLIIVLLLSVAASCDVQSKRIRNAKEYVAGRNDLSPDKRDAILRGEVLLGMAPDEAIAAAGAGQWSWLVFRKTSTWPDNADPLDMIYAQRATPDSTVFRLDFSNTTQFGTSEPITFSVCFANGKAFRISKVQADMCDTE